MVHENPVDLLRPLEEIADGLGQVGEVAMAAKDSARDRNDMDLYQFFWRMEDKAHWLSEQLLQANDTTLLSIPSAIGTPRHMLTYDCTVQCNRSACTPTPGQCGSSKRWRQVNSRKSSCGWTAFSLPVGSPSSEKCVVAVWQTKLPQGVPIWLSDATGDAAEIESIAGRPVVDMTPQGRLEQQHSVLQIPTDVKQSTAAGRRGKSCCGAS